jgi:hypothetical protein
MNKKEHKCPNCKDGKLISKVTKTKVIIWECSNHPKCNTRLQKKSTEKTNKIDFHKGYSLSFIEQKPIKYNNDKMKGIDNTSDYQLKFFLNNVPFFDSRKIMESLEQYYQYSLTDFVTNYKASNKDNGVKSLDLKNQVSNVVVSPNKQSNN